MLAYLSRSLPECTFIERGKLANEKGLITLRSRHYSSYCLYIHIDAGFRQQVVDVSIAPVPNENNPGVKVEHQVKNEKIEEFPKVLKGAMTSL